MDRNLKTLDFDKHEAEKNRIGKQINGLDGENNLIMGKMEELRRTIREKEIELKQPKYLKADDNFT